MYYFRYAISFEIISAKTCFSQVFPQLLCTKHYARHPTKRKSKVPMTHGVRAEQEKVAEWFFSLESSLLTIHTAMFYLSFKIQLES